MATRAIRTSADAVDMESDYTKYNFGVRDLWSGLVPKFSDTALQAQGISLENTITPDAPYDSVLGVIAGDEAAGGSSAASQNAGAGAKSSGTPQGAGKVAGTLTSMGTNMALGQIGVPSPVAGLVGNLAGSLVSKGELSGVDVGRAAAKSTLGAVAPSLAAGVAAIDAIAAAFGRQGLIDSTLEALGLIDVVPGFQAGLFGKQAAGEGIQASQETGTPAGYSEGDLGTGLAGSFGLGATTGITAGPTIGGLQATMDSVFAGLNATVDAISAAANGAGTSSGGYDAFGEGSLSDAVSSGNWGGSADSDSDSSSGSDSGPSGTGNSGNAGEG